MPEPECFPVASLFRLFRSRDKKAECAREITYGRICILLYKNKMPRFHRPAAAGTKRRGRRDLGGPCGPAPARTKSKAPKSAAPTPIGRHTGPSFPFSLPRPGYTPASEAAPAQLAGGPPDVGVPWDTMGHRGTSVAAPPVHFIPAFPLTCWTHSGILEYSRVP